jgi:hypothetical protein
MNKCFLNTIIATSVLAVAQTLTAQTTVLTDNFTVTSGGNVNSQLGSRQTGTYAVSGYTAGGTGGNQTGNTGTYVGQPGGAGNSAYLLMYDGQWVYNDLAFNDAVVGGSALSISFNIYQGVHNNQNSNDWTSFSFGTGAPAPNLAGQFGFLVEGGQGMQVFNGNSLALDRSDESGYGGFVTSDAWTVILSGTAAGTGSPFDGTTYVKLYNNDDPSNSMTGLGLVWSGQLTTPLSSGDMIGFYDSPPDPGWNENGIANLNVVLPQLAPPATPVISAVTNTLPTYVETVVGDTVVFSAAFSNSPVSLQWQQVVAGLATNSINAGVVNVTNSGGIINSTLTLNNVQTNNSGSYRLQAVNSTNIAYSSGAPLVVGSVPAPVNNIIASYAAQDGWGANSTVVNFYPTWIVNTTGDLLDGLLYSDVGGGDFNYNSLGASGDPAVLTDGAIGYETYNPSQGGSPTMVTCGDYAGQYVTYTLPSATYGYDLTNITVYGGWGDNTHARQRYTVTYSTVDAPNTFFHLADVTFDPADPSDTQSATRSVLTSATGALVKSVYSLRFSFNVGNSEGGFAGYSEIMAFGQPSVQVPDLTQDVEPVTALTFVGDSITFSPSFANATSYQWQKNGTNIPGATSPTLTLNNLQLTDTATNSGYGLVASNSLGGVFSSVCALTVVPVPAAVTNIITAISAQSQTADNNFSFTPDWVVDPGSLIVNQSPSSSVGNFDAENQAGDRDLSTLTDNTTSLAISRLGTPTTTSANYLTCGDGAGQSVVYTLATSGNGYSLTNITVFGGWADGGRDQQAYTVSYSTMAQPANFTPLTSVNYLPVNPVGLSVTRVELIPATGALATNVAAVRFDFTTPPPENHYCGYAKITMDGFVSANPSTQLVVTAVYENTATPDWVVPSPNLIAGQLPSSYDTTAGDSFTVGGNGGLATLTDGVIGTSTGMGASCGGAGQGGGTFITYSPTNGSWTLTNIVVFTGWGDYGRAGQFYNLSYSTVAAPTTFIPLTSVIYDPNYNDGSPWATEVTIAPPAGATVLASNVAAVHFDFTPQGTQDFGWSSYTEIVLQGTNVPSAIVIPPTLAHPVVSGGNLIVTGTGGTPNSGYTWLTTTNLSNPIIWTTNSTGTLSATGAFSNSIPVSTTTPARFFQLRLP